MFNSKSYSFKHYFYKPIALEALLFNQKFPWIVDLLYILLIFINHYFELRGLIKG